MTTEEKQTLTQAVTILEGISGGVGPAIALQMKKLIQAVEKTGKTSRFTVGNKENPLAHLAKEEHKVNTKRVTIKDTLPKNVLATSEKKTNNRKK